MPEKKSKATISTDVPKHPEKPISNIRSYFTKEINEQISDMSIERMTAILKDLQTSSYWVAILKYSQARMPMLDAQIRITDPYKDPRTIVFAQGCMAGLCDLESFIIDLNTPAPESAEPGAIQTLGTD